MFKKIALLAFFLAVVFSECKAGEGGCTTCVDGFDCDICDSAKFFFIKTDNTCIQLNGCKNASPAGACTKCDEANSYFPKTSTDFSECKLLSNCKTAVDQKCTVCVDTVKATHSIQEGECLKICLIDQKHNVDKTDCVADAEKVNGIVGCTAKADGANANSKCKTCIAGTTLSTSASKCVTDVQNCQTYTDIECDQCKTGFKLNSSTKVCEAETPATENVNNIAGCTAQADGPNAATQCKTCKSGTTLATSATKCVTDVQNCKTYNDTGCEQCITGFKLNTTSKACEVDAAQNVNNIVGCTAKADGADADTKCKTCIAGTTLATSATKCMTDVKDCQTYNDTGCEKCKTRFKLNTTSKACEQDKTSSSSTASSAIVSASLAVILAVFALAL